MIPCPVCEENFPMTGPDGVFVHLVTDHPASKIAQVIFAELARYGDRLEESPRRLA